LKYFTNLVFLNEKSPGFMPIEKLVERRLKKDFLYKISILYVLSTQWPSTM